MAAIKNWGYLPIPLEMWAGVECTLNRVGDRFFDQLAWSGHDSRPEDLDRFAGLGIQAIRYPVLWERIAPDGMKNANWQWTDERLHLLRDMQIRPIVGLVHHGSGPRHTSLLDPAFPQKLAEYARRVAERYSWVTAYTPINEPLTTARFSGLYGHWYPHLKDARAFIRMLINEIRGTQLAMHAIRRVNPHAQLVQTEDIGKIYSSPALDYQARHENERRWLTFDLLCGRVDRQHPLHGYITWLGISKEELEDIQRDALQPDILGINYYVTSERYLDDRIELFPEWMLGGNGRHAYADLEAVRVCEDELAGHLGVLQEVWDRYHLPLALTEVHLGGHREQQLRWWMGAWNAVQILRQQKVDIRAITIWSLLGSFNWNNLVTYDDHLYEAGVFDVQGSDPRPTLLANAIKSLSKKGTFEHPILNAPGWWQSADRLVYPGVRPAEPASIPSLPEAHSADTPVPILITGSDHGLVQVIQQACDSRNISCRVFSYTQFDAAVQERLTQLLAEAHPWAVIHAQDYPEVEDATDRGEEIQQINISETTFLAQLCATHATALLLFSFSTGRDIPASSQFVDFANGTEGESGILEANQQTLIVRTDVFSERLSPAVSHLGGGTRSLVEQDFVSANGVLVSSTQVLELVHVSLDLLIDGEQGVWHLTGEEKIYYTRFA